MINHEITTGDSGFLRIQDHTDNPDRMEVDLAVRSTVPVNIDQMPWTYSVDNVMSGWKSRHFMATTTWQRLILLYVGTAQKITLHLGNTQTSELGGPTDFSVNLAGGEVEAGSGRVSVRVDGIYKQATPFVRDNGIWKPAQPLVRVNGVWKPTV